MRKRAVRTRREPLGAQAGSPPSPLGSRSRNTVFPVRRPSDISSGANEAPPMVFTRHETRDTNHGFFGAWSTEALQSCFFCPGMLGDSSRRRRGTVPCGSRIGAPQAFTSRKPLILRSLRNENHESRVTAFMFFTNHESRNTNQGLCVFHESRMSNRCLLVLKPGPWVFQSFFSGPGCVA